MRSPNRDRSPSFVAWRVLTSIPAPLELHVMGGVRIETWAVLMIVLQLVVGEESTHSLE